MESNIIGSQDARKNIQCTVIPIVQGIGEEAHSECAAELAEAALDTAAILFLVVCALRGGALAADHQLPLVPPGLDLPCQHTPQLNTRI